MSKKSVHRDAGRKRFAPPGYDKVLSGVVELLETARRASARAVNSVMTATYWEIGRRIVEYEIGSQGRADYGEQVVQQLARDLNARFGRGFSRSSLYQMRSFFLAYEKPPPTAPLACDAPRAAKIVQTPSGKSAAERDRQIVQTVSGKSGSDSVRRSTSRFGPPLPRFPLPWSHYVRLLTVDDPEARAFYETEALRGGWSVRQLDRQIGSKFYERTLLSRNKAVMLRKGGVARQADTVTPEEEIKDPLVLEFLGLKDEYSETTLEEALIHHLEAFRLELGGDFTFVGRQRRLRVGDEWYRIDLVFFRPL